MEKLTMKKMILIILSVALMSSLILSGCPTPTEPTEPTMPTETTETTTPPPEVKTLKIGFTAPLSGPPSAAGIAYKQGWELAIDKINEEGGLEIGGSIYMVNSLVEDDKATTEGGTTAATKLVLQEGVKFVMGNIADFMVPSVYKATSEGGALYFTTLCDTSAASPSSFADVGSDKPLLIRMCNACNEMVPSLIRYLVEDYPNVKTLGVIALPFPEWDTWNLELEAALEPYGISVSSDFERFPADCVDFTPYMTRLLETEPDAILFSSSPSQFSLIVKAARDLGFEGPLMIPLQVDPTWALGAVPNVSDVFTTGLSLDDPRLPDSIKEVIRLGRAEYGSRDFVADSIWAYDQAMLLAQLLEKAQSLDPQTVQSTFESLTTPGSLQSVFGEAYVGGLETAGVNRILVKPFPVTRMVNGTPELLGMFTSDVP
jgi:branched-chain amino acid transport system substrate-binding protein